MNDTNHFVVGRWVCLVTMQEKDVCPHCEELRQRPSGPVMVVTKVDADTGTITFSAGGDE